MCLERGLQNCQSVNGRRSEEKGETEEMDIFCSTFAYILIKDQAQLKITLPLFSSVSFFSLFPRQRGKFLTHQECYECFKIVENHLGGMAVVLISHRFFLF